MSPGSATVEDDLLAGRVPDEELDLARPHEVERLAGVAGRKERLAGRERTVVDHCRDARAVPGAQVLEEMDARQHFRVTRHSAS